jgi:hypothetical protein
MGRPSTGAPPMTKFRGQSRLMSFVEAVTNVAVGYLLAVATQFAVFPSSASPSRSATTC